VNAYGFNFVKLLWYINYGELYGVSEGGMSRVVVNYFIMKVTLSKEWGA